MNFFALNDLGVFSSFSIRRRPLGACLYIFTICQRTALDISGKTDISLWRHNCTYIALPLGKLQKKTFAALHFLHLYLQFFLYFLFFTFWGLMQSDGTVKCGSVCTALCRANICRPSWRTDYLKDVRGNCFCACNAVAFVRHSITNTLKCKVLSRNTQNHEKQEHIEHIMGYIMFRHRKLVVVSMHYIYITLLGARWPRFFF